MNLMKLYILLLSSFCFIFPKPESITQSKILCDSNVFENFGCSHKNLTYFANNFSLNCSHVCYGEIKSILFSFVSVVVKKVLTASQIFSFEQNQGFQTYEKESMNA